MNIKQLHLLKWMQATYCIYYIMYSVHPISIHANVVTKTDYTHSLVVHTCLGCHSMSLLQN